MRAKKKPSLPIDETIVLSTGKTNDLLKGWLTGTGTNLLNPKVGVFYVATISHFIPADTPLLLVGFGLKLALEPHH